MILLFWITPFIIFLNMKDHSKQVLSIVNSCFFYPKVYLKSNEVSPNSSVFVVNSTFFLGDLGGLLFLKHNRTHLFSVSRNHDLFRKSLSTF